MMLPDIFGNRFFDDFDDFTDFPARRSEPASLMKSDVRDAGDHYVLEMDLPGIRKEDVKLQLKDGVLSFEASKDTNHDEKDENGKYIRRERFQGTCSRSFYVGEELKQEDIRAKFENGVLTVTVPKHTQQPKVPEDHYISIEG